DTLIATPFLDIRDEVVSDGELGFKGDELGLLGLAFHPQYAQNGFFYVNFTRGSNPLETVILETVICRFKVSSDPNIAVLESESLILSFVEPDTNHNGGQLQFGPKDGFLYIATRDGGGGADPGNNGQNPQSFLGKILRLNVDGRFPYTIPLTNPYAKNDGVLDEIWALGLRNPWRFSFDQATGDAYIADVGQDAWEEIDF